MVVSLGVVELEVVGLGMVELEAVCIDVVKVVSCRHWSKLFDPSGEF